MCMSFLVMMFCDISMLHFDFIQEKVDVVSVAASQPDIAPEPVASASGTEEATPVNWEEMDLPASDSTNLWERRKDPKTGKV